MAEYNFVLCGPGGKEYKRQSFTRGVVPAVMKDLVIRTVLIYLLVLVVIRVMGKREIGQLSPFDFVVAIIMAEIAAIPMQSPAEPIWHAVVPLTVLALLEVGLSSAALYSRRIRMLLDGQPQVVIQGGRILKKEMRKARYNLDDLMAQLRERGYPRPEDVEVAVIETSGRLSVAPKSGKRPVTPEDLGIITAAEGLPLVLVMDGEVLKKNIEVCGRDDSWLARELAGKGLHPGGVFLATLGRDGSIVINDIQNVEQQAVNKRRI